MTHLGEKQKDTHLKHGVHLLQTQTLLGTQKPLEEAHKGGEANVR